MPPPYPSPMQKEPWHSVSCPLGQENWTTVSSTTIPWLTDAGDQLTPDEDSWGPWGL